MYMHEAYDFPLEILLAFEPEYQCSAGVVNAYATASATRVVSVHVHVHSYASLKYTVMTLIAYQRICDVCHYAF